MSALTPERLELIEMTLREPVESEEELMDRAVTLHAICVELLNAITNPAPERNPS